jgi:hypothetical protein
MSGIIIFLKVIQLLALFAEMMISGQNLERSVAIGLNHAAKAGIKRLIHSFRICFFVFGFFLSHPYLCGLKTWLL